MFPGRFLRPVLQGLVSDVSAWGGASVLRCVFADCVANVLRGFCELFAEIFAEIVAEIVAEIFAGFFAEMFVMCLGVGVRLFLRVCCG